MTAYADYTFYVDEYRGSAISAADFPRLAMRASVVIDQVTFGQAAPIVTAATDTDTIDLIQRATCAVAEEIQRADDGGVIQSERVGQHSVTYAVSTVSDERRQVKAAKLYLAVTGLMYRGLDAD